MRVLTTPDHDQVHGSACRPTPVAPRGSGRRRWGQRAAAVLVGVPVVALSWATGAQAAPPDRPLGADVSHPQCATDLPTGQAFAIVGVNRGKPTTTNPCLAEQLAWAAESTGGTVHDDIQLYVNTANPAGDGSWPESGTNRYGDCDGSNSRPCAYQYGWERAQDDATIRGISHPEQYMWWLDVEVANSWDHSPGGATRNAAVLEGMTEYFTSIDSRGVGLYSSRSQWSGIVGNGVDSTSSLNGLPNWRPAGTTLADAQDNCDLAPLTPGGVIEMTQFTTDFDYVHTCI
jgi:hypothetical protein